MKYLVKLLVALPAVLFVTIGVRWLVAPESVAPEFGLAKAHGLGLSTQVGDLASFFLTLGSCMLIAIVSERRIWFYPPMMLLAIAALGRILAWLVHDAALAVSQITVEVLVALLLLLGSRRIPPAITSASS